MRLFIFGGMALFLTGAVIHDQYDKGANYVAVDARVSSAKHTCYFKKEEGRETSTTDTLDCDLARSLHKAHPEFRDADLKEEVLIKYSYTSPADGGFYTGSFEDNYGEYENAAPGGTIKILAHKTEPEKTRKP